MQQTDIIGYKTLYQKYIERSLGELRSKGWLWKSRLTIRGDAHQDPEASEEVWTWSVPIALLVRVRLKERSVQGYRRTEHKTFRPLDDHWVQLSTSKTLNNSSWDFFIKRFHSNTRIFSWFSLRHFFFIRSPPGKPLISFCKMMFALRNNNQEVVPCVPNKRMKCFRNYKPPFVRFSYSTSQQMSWSETIRKITYTYITLQFFFLELFLLQTTECIEIKFSPKMLLNSPEYV